MKTILLFLFPLLTYSQVGVNVNPLMPQWDPSSMLIVNGQTTIWDVPFALDDYDIVVRDSITAKIMRIAIGDLIQTTTPGGVALESQQSTPISISVPSNNYSEHSISMNNLTVTRNPGEITIIAMNYSVSAITSNTCDVGVILDRNNVNQTFLSSEETIIPGSKKEIDGGHTYILYNSTSLPITDTFTVRSSIDSDLATTVTIHPDIGTLTAAVVRLQL